MFKGTHTVCAKILSLNQEPKCDNPKASIDPAVKTMEFYI